jgi:hypothetical protein
MYLSYKLTIETYAGVDESHISLGMSKFKRGAGRTFATRRFWSDEPIETLPVDAVPHSIIGRTRCLELRGPLSRTDVSHFAEGLFNLQTVRLSANGLGQFPDGCPFAPETVVATLHPDNVQDRQRASWEAGSRWQLPHGVKRLLINIRFDTLFSSGRVRPFAYPSSLKEINIRFVGHLPEKLLHSFMCVDGLDVILRHIGPLNCGIKYTFIDAVNFALLWDQPAPSALQRSVTSSSASPGATVLQATRRLASVVRRKKSTQSLDIEHVGHLASKHQQLVPHVVGGPMHAVNRHAAEAALMFILRDAPTTTDRSKSSSRSSHFSPSNCSHSAAPSACSDTPLTSSRPSTPIYRTTPHIECCSLHEYVRRVGLDQFAMEAVDAAPMIL